MFFQDSVGVELSMRHAAIVHLKSSFRGIRLANHAVYHFDADNAPQDRDGIISRRITDFLKKCRPSTDCIYLGIPGEHTIIRPVELPLAVRENIRDTLQYELERFIPFNAADVHFDYQILGEDHERNRLKVLLAAIKKSDIAAYLQTLGDLSKEICSIEPVTLAVSNSLAGMTNDPAYALVYFDSAEIRISGMADKGLLLARSLPGTVEPSNLRAMILGSLKPLKPADGGEEKKPVRIHCLGPDVPAGLIREWDGADGFEFVLEDLSSGPVSDPELLGAYGLALRGFHQARLEINLLPAGLRKKPSRLGRYLTIGFAALALLSGLVWAGSHIVRQNMIIRDLDSRIGEQAAEIESLERLQAEAREITDRIEFINGIQAGRMTVLNILGDLTEIIPATAWVRDLNVSGDQVEIDGFADSASELIPLIDASPRFTEVAFLSAITRTRDGKERFRIGFKIRNGQNAGAGQG